MDSENGSQEYETGRLSDPDTRLFENDDEAWAIFREGKDSHMCDLDAWDIAALYNKVNRREDDPVQASLLMHPAETWYRR